MKLTDVVVKFTCFCKSFHTHCTWDVHVISNDEIGLMLFIA